MSGDPRQCADGVTNSAAARMGRYFCSLTAAVACQG